MGAGASVPEEITFAQAQSLAGEQWDDKLSALWPEGKETVTKDELLHLIRDVPVFAKKDPAEKGQDWDETPVTGAAQGGPAAETAVAQQMADEAQAPATVKAKVQVAQREKLDTHELRMRKLAEENGTTVEAVSEMQKLPPKPKRSKQGKKQSAELRKMMREQRKAARQGGRPMSRGLSEMECQLLVKEPTPGAAAGEGGTGGATRSVIVLGEVDPNKPTSNRPIGLPLAAQLPALAPLAAAGGTADPATE